MAFEQAGRPVRDRSGNLRHATLFALSPAVVGARLSHVLENLHDYTLPTKTAWENFVNMVNIRSGGLTYYGGLILAAPVVLGYVLWKKVPARLAMDISAPCIVLGLAVGRIGASLNGCCYGAETTVPWECRSRITATPTRTNSTAI